MKNVIKLLKIVAYMVLGVVVIFIVYLSVSLYYFAPCQDIKTVAPYMQMPARCVKD